MPVWQTIGAVLIALVVIAGFAFFLHLQDEERRKLRQTAYNKGIGKAYDHEVNRLQERRQEMEALRPKNNFSPLDDDPFRQALINVRLHKRKLDEERQTVTQNNYFSNNTIGNVSLGPVLGDLNASVQSLKNHGALEIADLIQKLTSGIRKSDDVKDADRKDLLENLSVVSNEVSYEPDKRRPGVLKASLRYITGALTASNELIPLVHQLHENLKAAGIINW